MKPLFKFLSIALIGSSLAFTSCSNDSNPKSEADADGSQIKMAMKIEEAENFTSDLIIAAYEIQQATEVGRTSRRLSDLPNCISVTIVSDQNDRELTLDFGSGGCTINGREVQGKIVFSYTRNQDNSNIIITANSTDFYYDGLLISGNRTLLREMSEGHPKLTYTANVEVTWPNGIVVNREGVIYRDWIEGYITPDLNDNVFEITGNWKVTFPNVNIHQYEIIEPLRRQVTCPHFVSGSIDVERTYFGGVIDFGDGECDNKAIFTFENGDTWDITFE